MSPSPAERPPDPVDRDGREDGVGSTGDLDGAGSVGVGSTGALGGAVGVGSTGSSSSDAFGGGDTDLGGRRRLSPRAVPYWRIDLALTVVPVAAVLTFLAALVDGPGLLRVGVPAVAWVGGLVAIVVVPPLRRRIWWYAIGEEEVDLREGLLVITRTVVPMVRVQHVDLHRGPISTRLGLAEIELHTAAGSVKIPALDRDEAERIRRQVSVLARVPDDL